MSKCVFCDVETDDTRLDLGIVHDGDQHVTNHVIFSCNDHKDRLERAAKSLAALSINDIKQRIKEASVVEIFMTNLAKSAPTWFETIVNVSYLDAKAAVHDAVSAFHDALRLDDVVQGREPTPLTDDGPVTNDIVLSAAELIHITLEARNAYDQPPVLNKPWVELTADERIIFQQAATRVLDLVGWANNLNMDPQTMGDLGKVVNSMEDHFKSGVFIGIVKPVDDHSNRAHTSIATNLDPELLHEIMKAYLRGEAATLGTSSTGAPSTH